MIDRKARDRAAALVEGFRLGAITNFQLEREWPDSPDNGIREVEHFVWLHYNDFKEHAAHQADRADPKLNALFSNCVKFLRSDEPYTWPLGHMAQRLTALKHFRNGLL